jgi:hypothetical protein
MLAPSLDRILTAVTKSVTDTRAWVPPAIQNHRGWFGRRNLGSRKLQKVRLTRLTGLTRRLTHAVRVDRC